MLSEIFGPSIYLLVLDLFLENPEDLMNLREIARRVEKNPGSISPVMPILVERGLVKGTKVGKVMVVYQLNTESEVVNLLMDFWKKLHKAE